MQQFFRYICNFLIYRIYPNCHVQDRMYCFIARPEQDVRCERRQAEIPVLRCSPPDGAAKIVSCY